ncbi:hypothetical protein [Streptomyces sp. rh195]|nr:hypothetical protein [Streptomyces sp. rh195]
MAAQRAAATAAAAASPLTAGPASQGSGAGLEGLQVRVFVGSEELSSLARTEVYKATGELVAIIDAGGGGN